MLVQLVQHDLVLGSPLQPDHDPHSVAIALVAELIPRNVGDDAFRHQLGDALDQLRLVHLVRYLGDDDRLPSARDVLQLRPRPHDEASASRLIALRNRRLPENRPARREVRPQHMLQTQREVRAVVLRRLRQHRNRRVQHLGQVVRRNVRRHAHRNARAAIDDQVRHARRQHRRLQRRLVVVRNEVDRIHVDVRQHLARDARQPRLRIPHRRRRIAVHRAEVPLTIDHQVAQRKRLRQPHHRVVNRRVAMRMVVTHHVPHHLGRLGVLLVELQPHLLHAVQNAAMHRLQAVAHVRQRAPDNDRHRVVEIRPAHLVLDIDRQHRQRTAPLDARRPIRRRAGRRWIVGVGVLRGRLVGVLRKEIVCHGFSLIIGVLRGGAQRKVPASRSLTHTEGHPEGCP